MEMCDFQGKIFLFGFIDGYSYFVFGVRMLK